MVNVSIPLLVRVGGRPSCPARGAAAPSGAVGRDPLRRCVWYPRRIRPALKRPCPVHDAGALRDAAARLQTPLARPYRLDELLRGLLGLVLQRQRPRTSMSASSTEPSSPASRRPADSPRRSGSTTVVCSTRTRVSSPLRAIVGRKLAGRALAE